MGNSNNLQFETLEEYNEFLCSKEEDLDAREELLRKVNFERSQSYTTTIISVGYASLFIIISILKDRLEIPKEDLSFIAFWLIISISIFIFWEVFGMINRAASNGFIAFITKNKNLRILIVLWLIALSGTIIPAGMVIFKLLNLLYFYISH